MTDKYGREWPEGTVVCEVCGQPDNCADCNHEPYTDTEAKQLGAVISCECSDEYGPCEQHGDALVVREGASVRTADESALQLIDDLADLGYKSTDEYSLTFIEMIRPYLEKYHWLDDPDWSDTLYEIAFAVESNANDVWVISNDGYVIWKLHDDCPLLMDNA